MIRLGFANGGIAWSRRIRTARHLQVDEAVLQPVAAHHFAHHHHAAPRVAIGMGIASSSQAAFETVEMALLIEQQAVIDRAHFVDGVGELQAAIFDVNGRARVREIAAVDIGDAAG